jgi:dynactin complex subunit
VCSITFYRIHEIGDQVVTTFQRYINIAPRIFHVIAVLDKAVEYADNGTAQSEQDNYEGSDDIHDLIFLAVLLTMLLVDGI